ncbi:SAM-dependent methyltransferase [Streptomyces sp. HNM0574]|uniref:SAM-dependent methyltransferase n=1 Tax=Streptomyces sp. HNM0574 TaxID=2714954 RepID=UPI00146DDB82|nr:SAM-dependent methyltransferase [Streptomyces sp. HNM0574]NLU70620.1 SAM-dependent methyltransferase [Streptomyces sp. HNM0574]
MPDERTAGGGDRVVGGAAPESVDVNTPSVARMYDHYLGGKDNYEVDRLAVAELDKVVPSTRPLALNNRSFLRRVVDVLAREYGVRQFLDHGSGLPTQDNVHQVAQRVDPEARVVYVDNDPIVLAHGRALLEENTNTAVLQADMRDTDGIFGHPEVERLIDPAQPVAALFVSAMHCIPDDSERGGPAEVLGRVLERVPSGSFVVVNQLVSPHREIRDSVTSFMDESTGGQWGRVREAHEVARYFDGLDVLEPGLGWINDWRRDSDLIHKEPTDEWYEFGGVARKP